MFCCDFSVLLLVSYEYMVSLSDGSKRHTRVAVEVRGSVRSLASTVGGISDV